MRFRSPPKVCSCFTSTLGANHRSDPPEEMPIGHLQQSLHQTVFHTPEICILRSGAPAEEAIIMRNSGLS